MWWWLKTAIGILIVVFTLRQMFQDLFHPTRSGALSDWLGHGLFRLFRRWPSVLATAGPLAVVVVIFLWAFLLVAGFAFIYWAVFPAAFNLKTVNAPTKWDGYWWSFYYSLEMLTTLGMGDIQPNPSWLRILSGCHTLVGFCFVTAGITWIILLYPALSRMRTLARKASALAEAEQSTAVSVGSQGMHMVLAGLAEEVIRTRVDLVHFPILFYFYSEDRCASLPFALVLVTGLAARGMEPDRDPLIRLTATALDIAVRALAENIGDRLGVRDRSLESVLPKFCELHGEPH